ncbi:related to Putative glycosyltransferase HOC1 [Saccharomycodes ludwigii]|uniref:Related to Putative glycosyltransferase HOC1 n=1 Tax=Saccharomycodes ludwigii TaxID=36035 RepID=A0A376BBZ7_9ASCO|nr:related to Putative glycosyltransferase HOC1 [Saccharomycodes ludwigii]
MGIKGHRTTHITTSSSSPTSSSRNNLVRVSKRGFNVRKFAIFIILPLVIFLFLIFRYATSGTPTDLQTLLQNLPKEIAQTINTAASKQEQDQELLQQFEKLTQELKRKNDEQMKHFDRQRTILEKKIHDLKQPPATASIREKLSWVYDYESTQKFPAFIWQTWPYSDADERLDENLRAYERSWGDKNPGFVHEIINDDTATALVQYFYNSIPEVVDTYNSLPSPMLKADFFKFLILFVRGGVFADMDSNPIQPVPNWIPENVFPREVGLVVGIEMDALKPDWKNKYLRRLQFGSYVIQCKPKHPIIREVIVKIVEITTSRKKEGDLKVNLRNDLNIMSWTGSGLFTDVIMTYFNDYVQSDIFYKVTWKDFHKLKVPKLIGDVLVFPQFSFNAPEIVDVEDPNKALYFVQHDGMKSWKAAPRVQG